MEKNESQSVDSSLETPIGWVTLKRKYSVTVLIFGAALLPIWIATYTYKGQSMRLLVNGQTGTVGGEIPRDWKKIAILIIGFHFVVCCLSGDFTMTLKAIQCEDCGGSVAFPEDKTLPECPFCGSTKQIPRPLTVKFLPPAFWLPFETSKNDADEAFRAFAKSSFWYPKDIRTASLELKTVLLLAWV